MKCKQCSAICSKAGKQKNGKQKWYCGYCSKYQQSTYQYKACHAGVNENIVALLKEGCGIRSIARLLKISTTTVLSRILLIANKINPPKLILGKSYQVDELRTFIQKKNRLIWVVCALECKTKKVVAFSVGRRTNKTLGLVLDSLLLAKAKQIYTDRLRNYRFLIPASIHANQYRATNHIERTHLNLGTHLKRLNRRSIAFSKSAVMLKACLMIYFWQ